MVTVTLKVNGRKLPAKSGFPYRQYSRVVDVEPELAEQLVDFLQAYARSAKADAQHAEPAIAPPGFDAFAATDEERAAAKRK